MSVVEMWVPVARQHPGTDRPGSAQFAVMNNLPLCHIDLLPTDGIQTASGALL